MQHITPASFAPETMADREDDMDSSQSHLVAAAMAGHDGAAAVAGAGTNNLGAVSDAQRLAAHRPQDVERVSVS
jgi:hypothetical protein